MNKYDYIEFGKIYRRVMDVEIKIKSQFKYALKLAYPSKMFYRLIPYLNSNLLGKYVNGFGKNRRDKIKDLISSNKTEQQKMEKFIDMAYLSDLVNLLTEYKLLYKNTNFTSNFYKTSVVFNNVKKYGSALKRLRNMIMHFQINDYKQAKSDCIDALMYFEQIMMCNNCYMYKIKFRYVTTKSILEQMSIYYPDFFHTSDREIYDAFDDIAFMNGITIDKLPKYWTIGRQIYQMRKDKKHLKYPEN